MKIFTSIIALSGMQLAMVEPAFAWGKVGHAVVADVAAERLTATAAAEVRRLLASDGVQRMSDVSSWADDVKRSHIAGAADHSVRLPLDGSLAKPHPCPDGFCADDAIPQYSRVLANRSASDRDREVALKYIIHLVGDLQQPLHDTDATGSQIPVIFDGRLCTLHKVWDDGIIRAHGGTPEQIARAISPLAGAVPSRENPDDWAEEGRTIARADIYAHVDPAATSVVVLPRSYARDEWGVVAKQLAKGGARLAIILNRCLT